MKIRPIGNRVLIRLKKTETKTAGGIYLPESSSEDKKQGIIDAIGDGKELHESGLKVGDTVIYGGYSATEVKDGDVKYLVIELKDVIAKIE